MDIIGNGLIANKFREFCLNENFLIFAAGVSNSQEQNKINFERENNLLKNIFEKYKEKRIIYFSTCSLNTNEVSEYKIHKENIEQYIKNNFKCYTIFRLPQVVGIANNKTLICSFIRDLKYGKSILVQSNATRHLLDVDDIPRLTKLILNNNIYENRIINIAPLHSIDIYSIIDFIASELNIDFKYEMINKGFKQNIVMSPLIDVVDKEDIILQKNYWKLVIRKYVKSIYSLV